jgi:hypothetical protein
MAVAAGKTLSSSEAVRLSESLRSLQLRESLVGTVREVVPPVEPVPDFLKDAYQQYVRSTIGKVPDPKLVLKIEPLFRGYEENSSDEWWQVFFYRFADVSKHRGANLNYRPLLPAARAMIVPDCEWVEYLRPRQTF